MKVIATKITFFRRLIQHQDLIKVWITITLQRRYFSMFRFYFIDLKHGQRNLPCQATVILHCPVAEKVSRNAPEHLARHQRLEAGENIMQSCTVKGTWTAPFTRQSLTISWAINSYRMIRFLVNNHKFRGSANNLLLIKC